MTHRHLKFLVLLVSFSTALAAGGHALQQWRAKEVARGESVTIATTRARLEGEWRERTQLRTDAPRLQSAAPARATTLAARAPIHPAASPAESPGAWAAMMSDASLQNLFLAAERASLGGRYAAVFSALKLNPAQAERLGALIMQRNEQLMDLAEVARVNNLAADYPALARLRNEVERAFRTQVIALVGEAGREILQQYERALPVWDFVGNFAGAAALEGEPLNETQAVQLTDILANASPPYRDGGRADPDLVEWPKVLTESAGVLTPPQQSLFLNTQPRYHFADDGAAPSLPPRD